MVNWNRRQFLNGLLAAASAGTAGSTLALGDLTAATPPTVPSHSKASSYPKATARLDDGVAHKLQDLLPDGVRFGRWRVVSVFPIKLGAVPVVLASRWGERFQVDILRRDRSARARRGLAETQSYSLFLLNRGHGDTPTLENHGLAVLWLAALLRSHESTQAPVALLTQRERTQRFPRGIFNALMPYTEPVIQPVAASLSAPESPTAPALDVPPSA